MSASPTLLHALGLLLQVRALAAKSTATIRLIAPLHAIAQLLPLLAFLTQINASKMYHLVLLDAHQEILALIQIPLNGIAVALILMLPKHAQPVQLSALRLMVLPCLVLQLAPNLLALLPLQL